MPVSPVQRQSTQPWGHHSLASFLCSSTSLGFWYIHMTSQPHRWHLSGMALVLNSAAAKKNIVTNASSVHQQIFRFWALGTYLPGWQQFLAFRIYIYTYSTWHQRWGAKCHTTTFQANHLFLIGCIRVCSKETRMDSNKSKICRFGHTDKHTNHDWNTHASRGFSYLQTLQGYYKEQHSVDTTQKQEFSCHVLCSDKLLDIYK